MNKKTLNATKRKAKERRLKREAGLIPLHVWVKPEWKPVVLDLIEQLKSKEK